MPTLRGLASIVALVLLPVGTRAQAVPLPDSTVRAVDKVFDAWRNTDGPGCALGVSRNGAPVFEKGYGMANLETDTPIRPSSIFHVASVSKQFTAMSIMLLVRDGKLSTDDDIRKFIPEIPDYGTPITIRHLLTHTSGLRDQWELIGLKRGRFEEDRITEADVMDVVTRQKALNFTPGAEYLYSNTGFTLLGVIVKRVSGQSLKDFAAERIFKPLGMTHTHFHDDYTMLVPGRTSAYTREKGVWHVSIPNFDTYGATSLFTTVEDLAKWQANFDHPVVGDATIVARMEAPTVLTTGDTSNYGFGITTGTYRGLRVVEHNGADAGYRSYTGRFPGEGLAISVLCNAGSTNPQGLARGVADVILAGRLTPAPQVAEAMPQGVSLTSEQLQRRVGAYIQPTTLQVIELALHDGKLAARRGAGFQPLAPLAEDRYRVSGALVEIVFGDGGFQQRGLQPGAGKPLKYERREPVSLDAHVLGAYAGSYVSEELGGTVYRVAVADSGLAFRTGTSDALTAHAAFADTFVGDGYTIQFLRTKGAVTGYLVTDPRMRRVAFTRLQDKR